MLPDRVVRRRSPVVRDKLLTISAATIGGCSHERARLRLKRTHTKPGSL